MGGSNDVVGWVSGKPPGGEKQAGIGTLRRTWREEEHEAIGVAGVKVFELGDDAAMVGSRLQALGSEG